MKWILAALMLAVAALALPALAQDAPVEPPDPDKLLDGARKDMAAIRKQLDDALDDTELQDFRKTAQSVQSRAEEAASALAPRLTDAQARLAQLGTPQAGVKEAAELASQRSQLTREVSAIDAQIKLAKVTAVEAEQAIATAQANRRMQLGARLGERMPSVVQSAFWDSLARERIPDLNRTRDFADQLGSVWRATPTGDWLTLAGAVAVILLVAHALRRLIAHLCATRVPAGRLRRSLYAVSVVVLRTLRPGLIAHGVVLTLTASAPANPAFVGWLETVEAIVWFGGFVAGLGTASLMPRKPSWRLLPLPDETAARLAWFPHTLAAVVMLGWLSSRTAATLEISLPWNGAVHALAALTFIAVLSFATVQLQGRSRDARLAAGAGGGADGGDRGGSHPAFAIRPLWLSVLRAAAWLVFAGSGVALLTGFVSLAMFAMNQFVWGLIVLGGAYLLSVLVDDLFMTLLVPAPGAADHAAPPAPAAGSATGSDAAPAPPRTREQTALLLSGLCRVSIGFFALLLLIAPYGEGPLDLFRRAGRFEQGLSIGELSLRPMALLQGVLVLVAGLVAVRLLKGWLSQRYMPTTRMDSGMRSSTTTLFGYVGTVAVIAAALSAVGFSLQSVAWVASALSVGIGFGLQSVVQNFVSGLILLAERPVKVGDWVSLSGVEGDIRRISVRATEIQMGDRSTVIVPNSEFITKIVRNVTYGESLGMVQFKLPMPLATDTERVKAVVLASFQAHPGVLTAPAPNVQLDGIDGDKLVLNASGFVSSPRAAYGIKSDLLLDVLTRLRAEGLLPGQAAPPA
jgi:small-conductance mechanosensitive channel